MAHLSVSFAALFNLRSAIPNFFIGNVGVDLFFVISGFIMVYASEPIFGSRGAASTFLSKRLIRIVPLYWACTAFQCYLYYRFGGAEIYEPFWRNLVSSLFFLPIPRADGTIVPVLMVGWTLNYEMLFYVMFSLALLVAARRLVIVVLVSTAFGLLVVLGLIAGEALPTSIRHLTNPLILEFLFGTWIAVAFRSGLAVKPMMAWPLVVVGLCLVYFSPSKGEQNIFRVATWGFGFALVVAAVALRRYDLSARNAFVQLGEASYSIYLTHWFVLMYPPLVITSAIDPVQNPKLFALVIFLSTLATGVFVYLVFERRMVPALRASLRRSLRKDLIAAEAR